MTTNDTQALPEPVAHRYWSAGHRSRWQLAGAHVPPDAEPLYSRAQMLALASRQDQQGQAWQAPEGWKLVPVEPTDAMRQAGGHVNSEWLNDNAPIGESRYVMPMVGVYRAMLDAAPSLPVGKEPTP